MKSSQQSPQPIQCTRKKNNKWRRSSGSDLKDDLFDLMQGGGDREGLEGSGGALMDFLAPGMMHSLQGSIQTVKASQDALAVEVDRLHAGNKRD